MEDELHMKFGRKWLVTGSIVLVGALMIPTQALADDTDSLENFNSTAEEVLQEQLTAVVDERGLLAEFGDVDIEATPELVESYGGDAAAYAHDILDAYKADSPEGIQIEPFGTRNYTSSVFSGVPAGGYCHVKQDFRATVTNYKVTAKSLRGSSYQTGVCVFAWSPNYSYFSGSFNVHSKGTYHAIVKGAPISFSATFKAIYTVQKSSLKQHAQ